MKTILLLSHSKDFYNIDRVAAALAQQGVPHFRLNTDRFPESIYISHQLDASGTKTVVQTEDGRFNTQDIGAVWPRKIWSPIIQAPMEEKYRVASIREAVAVRKALFQMLAEVPWIDPLPAMTRASDKFLQLRCAQQAGLRLPQTLISNDADAVRVFYDGLGGEMVCKLHTALTGGMQASAFSFYTTKIAPEDMEAMDMLSVCPMIFQEFIPKRYELRIAYIDGQCFTGKIEAAAEVTDWRIPEAAVSPWKAYKLPEAVVQQLQAFMQNIGLSFGAIDMIRHADGSYVFLEVNPSGEWGMLEKELDYPIAQAIADGLIKRMETPSPSTLKHLL